MYVEEILARKGDDVVAVSPDSLVKDVVAIIGTRNIGTAVVTDSAGALLGIVSERDVIASLNTIGGCALELRVSDLMTKSVITCEAEATVSEALSQMALHRIRHLPVLRGRKLLGLISIRDVLEHRLDALEQQVNAWVQMR